MADRRPQYRGGENSPHSRAPHIYNTMPPPLPPDTGPPRRRNVYPPRPCVEDEIESLAKEAGSEKLLKKVGEDEVPSQGTIDQEPIIEDVSHTLDIEARHGPLDLDRPNSGMPTPPTSDDEKTRKASRKTSRLNMNLDEAKKGVPEVSQRTASPYAFSKPPSIANEEKANDRYLSPDTISSSPLVDSQRIPNGLSRSQPSSPRHDSATQASSDYFSTRASPYDRSKASTFPPPPPNPMGAQSAVTDFATKPDMTRIRQLNLDGRRNTDTANTLPTLPKLRMDKSRQASSRFSDFDDSAVYSSPGTPHASSRPVSPAGNTSQRPTPPRSPRGHTESPREQSSSQPNSRRGSVTGGSRPSSPSPRVPGEPPRLPNMDVDWSALLNAQKGRSKPRSRLTSSMRQDSISSLPPEGGRQVPATRNLPELVDGGETPTTPTANAKFPQLKSILKKQPTQEPESYARPGSSGGLLPRPSFHTRHHSANDLPQLSRRAQYEKARGDEPKQPSSQTKKDLQAVMQRGFASCPRRDAVAGYSDWYTLVGAPSLDFCPDCVEDVFDRTVFRNAFRRSPPHSYDTKVQCAFGASPWIRLAWLLTLQQERLNLNLMKDIAEIEHNTEACPGNELVGRTWYGLQDQDGYWIENLRICYSDVLKIERLLPSLKGLFGKIPNRTSYAAHKCAIRTEGNRFSIYLDSLISCHEQAEDSRRGADPQPFVKLLSRWRHIRECTRDDLLVNGLWHYIPNVPEFTVCGDCFEYLVAPEVQKHKDLAMRFSQTVQPVYDRPLGSSCQLYSRRMRKVFRRAVEENDMRYLSRKAKERRAAEVRLQEEYKDILRRADIAKERDAEYFDKSPFDRAINRIAHEWRHEWE